MAGLAQARAVLIIERIGQNLMNARYYQDSIEDSHLLQAVQIEYYLGQLEEMDLNFLEQLESI